MTTGRLLLTVLAAAALLSPLAAAQPQLSLPLQPQLLYALSRQPAPWTAKPCSEARVYLAPRPDLVYGGEVRVRAPLPGVAEARGGEVYIRSGGVEAVLGGLKPLEVLGRVSRGQAVGVLDASHPILWVEVRVNGSCVPLYALLAPGELAALSGQGVGEAELRGTGWAVLRAVDGGWWAVVNGSGGGSGALLFSRGVYASTWNSSPGAAELYWLSLFQVVEVGGNYDPASRQAMEWLHGWGVKVVAYIWMPAGYHFLEGGDNPFMRWVYENRGWASLNPNGPYPHTEEAGYWWAREYYFDLGNGEVLRRRVEYLEGFAGSHGYQGFFFDWASGSFLEEPEYRGIAAEWRRRHPGLEYQEAVAELYRRLARDGWLIVTNQAFRKARWLLPLPTYDMTESYIVGSEYYGRRCSIGGREVELPDTQYYPVSSDPLRGSLSDTLYYIDLLNRLAAEYGGPRFKGYIYMNYAAPRRSLVHGRCVLQEPRNAVYYSLAMALIAGHHAYLEVPFNKSLERDPVYFYYMGRPVGPRLRIPHGYARYYEHGVAVAGLWPHTSTVTLKVPPGVMRLYDPYTGSWLTAANGTVTVTLTPVRDQATGLPAPLGRILLYEYRPPRPQPHRPPLTYRRAISLIRRLTGLTPI